MHTNYLVHYTVVRGYTYVYTVLALTALYKLSPKSLSTFVVLRIGYSSCLLL